MRFKDDNDNRYRVNFTRATEAHIDKMTVSTYCRAKQRKSKKRLTKEIYKRVLPKKAINTSL